MKYVLVDILLRYSFSRRSRLDAAGSVYSTQASWNASALGVMENVVTAQMFTDFTLITAYTNIFELITLCPVEDGESLLTPSIWVLKGLLLMKIQAGFRHLEMLKLWVCTQKCRLLGFYIKRSLSPEAQPFHPIQVTRLILALSFHIVFSYLSCHVFYWIPPWRC